MADIAVEKKSGMGWLVWLLIAAAVVLLLWWAFAGRGGQDGMTGMTGALTGERGRTADEAPIRDVATLAAVADAGQVEGRRVELDNVRVVTTAGDRSFWVTGDQGRQALVRMDHGWMPGTGTDGLQEVTSGQTVRVTGEARRLPEWETARTDWNMNPDMRTNFENQRVYISADRVERANAGQAGTFATPQGARGPGDPDRTQAQGGANRY